MVVVGGVVDVGGGVRGSCGLVVVVVVIFFFF